MPITFFFFTSSVYNQVLPTSFHFTLELLLYFSFSSFIKWETWTIGISKPLFLDYSQTMGNWRGLPRWHNVKNLPENLGDTGSIHGSGRSPGEGNDNPLQYSHLKNPMDRGAWWATVNGVTKSWTQLSNWAHTKNVWYNSIRRMGKKRYSGVFHSDYST